LASTALWGAIVVASASSITGVPLRATETAALGAVGVVICGVGCFAPELMHAVHHAAPR
jgi:dihydrodipicolinate synthase/N-acetylneuraminate lyase